MEKMWQQALDTLDKRYGKLTDLPYYHNKWSYDLGVVLNGVKLAYELTGEEKYFHYLKTSLDYFIDADGTIRFYDQEKFNLDFINNGKLLFLLFEKTGDTRYKKAMDTLYQQLLLQPRTKLGGFWHKKIYPEQMWLDGLYMAEPFYAEYLVTFKDGQGLEDVLKQFQLAYAGCLDEKTGLLFHAYDEEKKQPWADATTGHSPHFWGRAVGWYLLGLADTMKIVQDFPEIYQGLAEIFEKTWAAVKKVQDPQSRCWYQVLDQGARHGNYLEASCSAMFLAASAKAYTLGLIPDEKIFIAESFAGFNQEFVLHTKENYLNVIRNCQVAGLGGDDSRDGSFVYYISEPIITNDFKGYGAYIQASLLIENFITI
ncbi:glycoside hydrolase family 88/105 protein [Enterococcus timonensis]|uniref:glycoside hydrolase family 88/105 protein n=1 Tax=Enterococcus timonensis TaxID=1852364 RepID=UPI0008D948E0|nr:glycoside hydrolase family 88 protein [Enterococcus timonensis]